MEKLTDKKFWEDQQKEIKLPLKIDLERTPVFQSVDALFQKYLPKNKNFKFLEIGCAPGRWLAYFKERFNYKLFGIEYTKLGSELTEKNLKLLKIKAQILNEDIFETSLKKESFNIVFSYGFLEHFKDLKKVFKVHYDLVKKGGYIIINVPNFNYSFYYFLQGLIDKENLKKHLILSPERLKNLVKSFKGKILFLDYLGSYYPYLIDITKLKGRWLKIFDIFAIYSQAIIRRLRIKTKSRFFSPYIFLIFKKQ
jgi:SAM-dependent methyltransferase